MTDNTSSHYDEPIDAKKPVSGTGRNGWDVPPEVQQKVIDIIIEEARKKGFNNRDTAYYIAIAKRESSFNPDAASTWAGDPAERRHGQADGRTAKPSRSPRRPSPAARQRRQPNQRRQRQRPVYRPLMQRLPHRPPPISMSRPQPKTIISNGSCVPKKSPPTRTASFPKSPPNRSKPSCC